VSLPGLLRACRERPSHCRAAEQRDEGGSVGRTASTAASRALQQNRSRL